MKYIYTCKYCGASYHDTKPEVCKECGAPTEDMGVQEIKESSDRAREQTHHTMRHFAKLCIFSTGMIVLYAVFLELASLVMRWHTLDILGGFL